MKTVQLSINTGGEMSKSTKKPSSRNEIPPLGKKSDEITLTASQRRLLQLLIKGTESEEPNVLAAGRL
ncbi:hypothetical protein CKQ80_06200 [Pseudomonas moraviensis]|uniref:Uncharacterized protein n=1 Tax=Pseudomonas moraviensis TaxID=321662 RepID=A0A2A2PH58_9PSED|nr:hypothetical protein CKQ68_24030 [Pseudomonas moraviensis]PAW54908.1 hypothetical protein CKQ80_06200 [Pseudomonas moraviensis]